MWGKLDEMANKILAKNKMMKIGFASEKSKMVVTSVKLLPTIDSDKLYEQVSLRIGHPKAVVKAVMEGVSEAAMTFLSESHGVPVGSLGYLYPALKSKAGDTEDEAEVLDITVRLRPSMELRKAVQGLGVRVEKLDGTVVESDEDEDDTNDEDATGTSDGSGTTSGSGDTNSPSESGVDDGTGISY